MVSDLERLGIKRISLSTHSQKNDDELVFKLVPNNDDGDETSASVTTGNYIGRFKYNNIDIEISSRFGEHFLKRMLNFADDVYFDEINATGEIDKENKKEPSTIKLIIYYLFVQNLEKAILLGLPSIYDRMEWHDLKMRGKIDVRRHIKDDVPFKGKLSTNSIERTPDKDIIDVIYNATLLVIKSYNPSAFRKFMPLLASLGTKKKIRKNIILAANNSKALNNPIYQPYRNVLKYAEIILNLQQSNSKNSKDFPSYILNVAELFEIYIRKLIQYHFSAKGWYVHNTPINLYSGQFYARKIIPDIIMEKGNDVAVFDTKYKSMKYLGKNKYGMGDVDRNDFFQINTYMSYYKQTGKNLICGGLIYPIDSERSDEEKILISHADWFGDAGTKFIVDGIMVSDKNIKNSEKKMVDFISKILGN